ncbi:MAG: hypothetical protein JWN75_133 [Candidatus Saccharibacteria bacterium]|nr:hypothetical protein [Candidatus Saccharibacteria bacterium]
MEMIFKPSQRSEIASIMRQNGLEPNDFRLKESDNEYTSTLTFRHTKSDASFTIESNGNSFEITFSPSESSMKSSLIGGMAWNSVTQYVAKWASYVRANEDADDPWSEQTEEAFKDFQENENNFTQEELARLDPAIESSFEQLLLIAKEKGYTPTQKDLLQISEDIKYLKDEARKSSKRKWLDLFMGIVVTKLVDWGLESGLFGIIVAKLFEMSHEVLKLSTHLPVIGSS